MIKVQRLLDVEFTISGQLLIDLPAHINTEEKIKNYLLDDAHNLITFINNEEVAINRAREL